MRASCTSVSGKQPAAAAAAAAARPASPRRRLLALNNRAPPTCAPADPLVLERDLVIERHAHVVGGHAVLEEGDCEPPQLSFLVEGHHLRARSR